MPVELSWGLLPGLLYGLRVSYLFNESETRTAISVALQAQTCGYIFYVGFLPRIALLQSIQEFFHPRAHGGPRRACFKIKLPSEGFEPVNILKSFLDHWTIIFMVMANIGSVGLLVYPNCCLRSTPLRRGSFKLDDLRNCRSLLQTKFLRRPLTPSFLSLLSLPPSASSSHGIYRLQELG